MKTDEQLEGLAASAPRAGEESPAPAKTPNEKTTPEPPQPPGGNSPTGVPKPPRT
jgi:hypothetical protein